MRSTVIGAFVLAGIFGLAGQASADVTNSPNTGCVAVAVCAPVNVPVLTINRLLTDIVHLGSSSQVSRCCVSSAR
jgi:hypothetical protein